MKTKNTTKIALFLLVATLLLPASLAIDYDYEHDVGIRYSYSSSFGTGIAIQEDDGNLSIWLNETTPKLMKEYTHKLKYYIDNLGESTEEAEIIVRLNNEIIYDYNKTINTYSSKTVELDVSQLEYGLNTLSIELILLSNTDEDLTNNHAERDFQLTSINGVCGNGLLEVREECDYGTNNGIECSPETGESCNYCSSECTIETIQSTSYESGTGFGIDVDVEDFAPLVWACGNRVVYDDNTEPGRISPNVTFMFERLTNYAFEGEQIVWTVLVMDKNGFPEKISDVFATMGPTQGAGNDIEVNCNYIGFDAENTELFDSCNARIGEEWLQIDNPNNPELMGYYDCIFTIETPASMYGEHWLTVEALDLNGLSGTMDENEYWFLNPEIALSVSDGLNFENVRPGTSSYSDTILIGNDADDGSGVLLDMFISGTDFYDSSSSGAMCPTTNQLSLEQFSYFATNGAYSTRDEDPNPWRTIDDEGYVNIQYGIGFNDPNPFYDRYEILPSFVNAAGYYAGNILTPGAELALTFKLDLPEPCNGDFDTGQIYFWGEAI